MKRVDMGQEGEDLSTTREIEHQKQRQKENQTQYQRRPRKDKKYGSERESGKLCILRGFLKNEELGLGCGEALRFEQQVMHVSIATAASEQSFEVAVDSFNHSHRYLGPAVVQDAFEMIQQHAS